MLRAAVFVLAGWLLLAGLPVSGQRVYAPHSVLATGNWYKIAIKAPGIYKIDLAFLASLGITGNNLSSSSFRLFGREGNMLPESNTAAYTDDLTEMAVKTVDGGDGVLNGSDYILFYAPGPQQWIKDSASQTFSHRKNLYSNQSFYYITIGGNGKRVADGALLSQPAVTVSSFTERYFHELDTVSFLSGGKEWYGEEFANAPGKLLSRDFSLPLPGIINGSPLIVKTSCLARAAGAASRFDIRINGQPAAQLSINPVGTGTYDPVAQPAETMLTVTAPAGSPVIGYTFVPGSFNAQGWLNWFEVTARCSLSMNGSNQLLFRDWNSTGNQRLAFNISNTIPGTQVWDITVLSDPVSMPVQQNNGILTFINDGLRLREYIAFTGAGYLQPVAVGRINNQDLHAGTAADLIIVTHASLLPAARRIAEFHRVKNNMRYVLVSTEQVYQEFSAGQPDPSAIRDFVKMYYDRFGQVPADKPRYLLLLGDASYDYLDRIPNNTNLVPAWQSAQSLDPLSTYVSDDFFGFLDNNEDITSGTVLNLLDIGIGRVPAGNPVEAGYFADKLEAYAAKESMGPWRSTLSFVADDEDNNLHFQDAELISATAAAAAPVFNLQKLYLDAYKQESGPGGSNYPLVNLAINNQVNSGTLVLNYNGHGGSARLAEETILDQQAVNSWDNKNRLPLFITATCDFAPYDNPQISSLGENLLLRKGTGAIALMTTTRPVFAYSNKVMNTNYIRFALEENNGVSRSLGDAVKEAKNFTYQGFPDIANNRKFTLLGDPAMTLAFPALQVRPVTVNAYPVTQADTLSAGETVTIEGEVADRQGNLLGNYNGNVYVTMFDKPQLIQTLGNDPASQPASFQLQQNSLFRGKFTVQQGRFRIGFKVPRDINFQYGNGRLSLYAEDGSTDGKGLFTNIIVGGISASAGSDKEGPEIKAWLNDEKFVSGGLCNTQPLLLLRLTDSSGINTTGLGIGHDLVATLDGDNNRYYILNDFYEADADSYQQGRVRFRLPGLTPGPHSLKIKAWDVMNNSAEITIEFIVADEGELELRHVLNYPNPFTSSTAFWFEHNQPGQSLQVQVQVMTITGRVVRSLTGNFPSAASRLTEIVWDGKDDYGSRLGRGVYLYKLRVTCPGKKAREVLGKLQLL